MGEPDKVNLQAALEASGWRVERQEGDIWWAHEIWSLTSLWRPVGARMTLTLLVDPHSETEFVSDVWAIAVSLKSLSDWMESSEKNTIRVRPKWPERMKEIVELTETMRPQAEA